MSSPAKSATEQSSKLPVVTPPREVSKRGASASKNDYYEQDEYSQLVDNETGETMERCTEKRTKENGVKNNNATTTTMKDKMTTIMTTGTMKTLSIQTIKNLPNYWRK